MLYETDGTVKIHLRCKRLLVGFTVLRIILLLDVHVLHFMDQYTSITSNYLQSAALRSILVNPVYTLKHLREALFVLRFNSESLNYGKLYANGSTMHLPPLLMAFFEPLLTTIKSEPAQNLIIGLLMIFVDLAVALLLFQIVSWAISIQHDTNSSDCFSQWETKLEPQIDPCIQPEKAWIFGIDTSNKTTKEETKVEKQTNKTEKVANIIVEEENPVPKIDEKKEASIADVTHPIVSISDLPLTSCLLYYCNPFSVLSVCVTKEQTFQSIVYLFLLLSLNELIPHKGQDEKKQSISMAAFYISLLTYLELYPVVFLVPMIVLIRRTAKNNQDKNLRAKSFIGFFLLWTTMLQALSCLLIGSKNVVSVWIQTYGYSYSLKDIPPNLKALWYFSVQIIGAFHSIYTIIMAAISYLCILPLVIRLHRYPFVLVTMFTFLWIFYRKIMTLPDIAFAISLLALSPKSLIRMRIASLISILAMPVPIAMYTFDHWMWLEAGSGNPNYMFFQCIAFEVFFTCIFLDFLVASLKRDKALRVTEKNRNKKP